MAKFLKGIKVDQGLHPIFCILPVAAIFIFLFFCLKIYLLDPPVKQVVMRLFRAAVSWIHEEMLSVTSMENFPRARAAATPFLSHVRHTSGEKRNTCLPCKLSSRLFLANILFIQPRSTVASFGTCDLMCFDLSCLLAFLDLCCPYKNCTCAQCCA